MENPELQSTFKAPAIAKESPVEAAYARAYSLSVAHLFGLHGQAKKPVFIVWLFEGAHDEC